MGKILTFSIAAYNVANTIEETLNSLVCDESTMECMEVLIVDDGSTDNTYNEVSLFLEQYPNTFRYVRKENGGHGSTLTYSIKHANWKYFSMLDGDDLVYNGNLKEYVDLLKNTDVDVVVSPFVEFYEDKREDYKDRHNLDSSKIYGIEDTDKIEAHEFAFRTELLRDKNVQLEKHCCYEDTEYCFYVTMYAQAIIKYNNPIYRYRKGVEGQTVSDSGRRKHPNDPRRVLLKMMKECDRRGQVFDVSYKHEVFYQLYDAVMNLATGNIFSVCDYTEKERCVKYGELCAEIKRLDGDYLEHYYDNWPNLTGKFYYMLYTLPSVSHYVIWGCGRYGVKAVAIIKELYKDSITVTDSNSDKWGESFCDETIVSPEEAISLDNNDTIFVVAMKDGMEVKNILIKKDVDEGIINYIH